MGGALSTLVTLVVCVVLVAETYKHGSLLTLKHFLLWSESDDKDLEDT